MGASPKALYNPRIFQPISLIEFANSLLSTWRTTGSHHKHVPTIGLAVSGGVDSMALAVLCSKVQQTEYWQSRALLHSDFGQNASGSPLSRDVKFQAFVVDHGVREGSNLEAQAVSKVLEERKIPTKLLKIDWAGHERPGELPNFESLARKHRFQALGKACLKLGINSLLLAHHEDDQAETVMARLVTTHRASGLMGMKPSSEIPECYGLHGVHESGGLHIPEWGGHRKAVPTPNLPEIPAQIPSLVPLNIETGGVRIYRPLLGFSKDRLISTCVEERMEWFEDHTNNDPKVTMRNAIRHIFRYRALPAALSKPALLKLSKRCRDMQLAKYDIATSWLQRCSVKFGTRTGTLRVRFANMNDLKASRSERDEKYIAALLLRRIVMLVTPQEHVNLPSLKGAVDKVFPECFWTQLSPPPAAFTVASLYFKLNASANLSNDSTAAKGEWLISRQPYKRVEPQPRIMIPACSNRTMDVPLSPWSLYDGRYWIRVQNLTKRSIVIRPFGMTQPFAKDEPLPFCGEFLKSNQAMLRSFLNRLARYGITRTLPAIVCRDSDGKERVLALPTLGVSVPNVGKLVRWEVRYKKVDVDHISPTLESKC